MENVEMEYVGECIDKAIKELQTLKAELFAPNGNISPNIVAAIFAKYVDEGKINVEMVRSRLTERPASIKEIEREKVDSFYDEIERAEEFQKSCTMPGWADGATVYSFTGLTIVDSATEFDEAGDPLEWEHVQLVVSCPFVDPED